MESKKQNKKKRNEEEGEQYRDICYFVHGAWAIRETR